MITTEVKVFITFEFGTYKNSSFWIQNHFDVFFGRFIDFSDQICPSKFGVRFILKITVVSGKIIPIDYLKLDSSPPVGGSE